MNYIVAVVTTFNRIEKLKKCISCLQEQTYTKLQILVVDNASNQETTEYMNEKSKEKDIDYLRLPKNIGGAGGFSTGIQYALKRFEDADGFWILDDDTMPTTTALDTLVKAANKISNVGFLCSDAIWIDGNPAVMNIPVLSSDWNKNAEAGVVKVDSCSFVSVLISREAVVECGYPIADFFIWGDDVEYTSRISKIFDGYFVPTSVVVHEMASNNSTKIENEEGTRVGRYFYSARNRMWRARQAGLKAVLREIIRDGWVCFKIFRFSNGSKLKKISIILKGACAGVSFKPAVNYGRMKL